MEYLAFVLVFPFVWACLYVLFPSVLGGWRSPSPRLPPGPKPLPIIGNILELGNLPHRAVAKLSETYGPLMALKLGNMTTIVISSPDLAREALQTHDAALSGRSVPDTLRVFNHYKVSMLWLPSSSRWRNLRKVASTQMFLPRRLDSTKAIRRKKVQELLDHVKGYCSSSGQVIDIGQVAFTTALNAISNTFFSTDLAQYGSNASQEFQDLIDGIMEEVARPNIADYFPALRFVDPQGARRRMTTHFRNLFGIFDGIIRERVQLRTLSKGSGTSGDLLDYLLNITEEDNSELSYGDIKHLLLDLFTAGIDTTSSTVEWTMAELLRNPSKLAKAREELEEVLGKDRLIQESDISMLPYLRATVKETFRLHPPAPFLVPHKAEKDIEMCGFTVPKNARVLVNVWAMGRDPRVWSNPKVFMPERFLEKEIDFKGKDFGLIPFGAGRRICPGLPLADRTVHLMLASLLYHFNWKLAEEIKSEDIYMSEKFGITIHKAEPLRAIPIIPV